MKKSVKLILQSIIICCFLLASLASEACTVFCKSTDGEVLFGNVENEQPHFEVELHFVPPEVSKGYYGHFFMQYNGNIAGGMNDQGLCFDVAGLPLHDAFNGKPHHDLMTYLLQQCATLDEALEFFYNYYWPGHNVNHIMIMDKTGASAIVELIGSSLYIFRKEGNHQVMTNYSIADPEIHYGEYPCSRFEKANEMLDTSAVTITNFQLVCENVSKAYYDALYSNIYNPNTLDIHFFNANSHGSPVTTFNLVEEYNKGSHYFILKNNQIISGLSEVRPKLFSVSANSPNPFTTETSFSLTISKSAKIKISIIDIHGKEIDVLENAPKTPGNYRYLWNSAGFPSGIYFLRIRADGIVETRKWIKR